MSEYLDPLRAFDTDEDTDIPIEGAPPGHVVEPVERDLTAPARWYALVLRRREDGRYLLVRSDEDAAPKMLTTWPPHPDEGLQPGIASLVRTHLGISLADPPMVADTTHPARMGHPYTGGPALGLWIAVACETLGDPSVDARFTAVEILDRDAAVAALATDLERAIFRDGVALLR